MANYTTLAASSVLLLLQGFFGRMPAFWSIGPHHFCGGACFVGAAVSAPGHCSPTSINNAISLSPILVNISGALAWRPAAGLLLLLIIYIGEKGAAP